jgi:hypothetical protein
MEIPFYEAIGWDSPSPNESTQCLRTIKPESLAFIAFVQLNAISVKFFEIGVAACACC